jgi:hypothetical protein
MISIPDNSYNPEQEKAEYEQKMIAMEWEDLQDVPSYTERFARERAIADSGICQTCGFFHCTCWHIG